MSLAILDLQVAQIFPIVSSQLAFPFRNLGFAIRTILAIFDLQITVIFLTKFRVNKRPEKKAKIDIQDRRHGGHVGFQTRTILAILIYRIPQYFLSSFESIGLSVQEKFKIHLQHGRHDTYLGFQIGMILVVFDLQVTLVHVLPISVHVPLQKHVYSNILKILPPKNEKKNFRKIF